ncbi:hypothetical protein MKW98_016878, partial [Papaver atlanticum]
NSKYSKLKRVIASSVANTKKNALRERNKHVQSIAKLICNQYGNPLPNINFTVVSPNEEVKDISSSEDEEEDMKSEFEDEEELEENEGSEGHSEGDHSNERGRVSEDVLDDDAVNIEGEATRGAETIEVMSHLEIESLVHPLSS